MKKDIIAFSIFLILGAIFLLPNLSLAANSDINMFYNGGNSDVTAESLRQTTGLGSASPIVVAINIVRIALGFLGIIAVSLIIYGGWVYMTSEGNEEKIERAKNILKNAVIGLIIILSAFAIVSFIISRLTNSGYSGPGSGSGGPGFNPGFGVIGSCSVESVYPEYMQEEVPRNTSIIVTFKEEVDPETICGNPNGCDGDDILIKNVKIYIRNQKSDCVDNDNNCVSVKAYSTDNKTFVFVPDSYLGSASEYIWYEGYMSNAITVKDTDKSVFEYCRTNLNWAFEVSNKLDLTPPQIESVFPAPDNAADEYIDTGVAVQAEGTITVDSQPQVAILSSVVSVATTSPSDDINVSGEYNCLEDGTLGISIGANGSNYSASGVAGAVGGSVVDNKINVCGLKITPDDDSFVGGNSWAIEVKAAQDADTLNVNRKIYIFVDNEPVGNQIQVGVDKEETAQNIAVVLNNEDKLEVSVAGNVVTVKAAVAGSGGNNIIMASESNALDLSGDKLSDGADSVQQINIKSRKDKPINAVIQINFDEAMMPTTLSGPSDEVKDYIKVVEIKDDGTEAIVAGRFELSNGYKTVEFIPNNECGVNNCGNKVYCLPKKANLKIEIKAAELQGCTNNDDCVARSPYTNCDSVCQDSNTPPKNYPLSQVLTGASDACLNSMDGDRNSNPEGPDSFYNENEVYGICDNDRLCTNQLIPEGLPISRISCSSGDCAGAKDVAVLQTSQGDSYAFSFYTSDEFDLSPPSITSTNPGINDSKVDLNDSVKIWFDKLIMSSTLKTGGTQTLDETTGDPVSHRYVNLWNFTNNVLGYWIGKREVDDPRDNEPDYTIAQINHTLLSDSSVYRAQIGSGVQDIYQNCFLPSEGPACNNIDQNNPSCCNGTTTAALDDLGNCP